jgi:hypothetical protein
MSLLSRNKTGLLGVGPLAVRQAAQQRRAGMLAAPRAPSPIAATGRPITLSNQWDGVGEGLAALGKGLFGDKEAMEKKKREEEQRAREKAGSTALTDLLMGEKTVGEPVMGSEPLVTPTMTPRKLMALGAQYQGTRAGDTALKMGADLYGKGIDAGHLAGAATTKYGRAVDTAATKAVVVQRRDVLLDGHARTAAEAAAVLRQESASLLHNNSQEAVERKVEINAEVAALGAETQKKRDGFLHANTQALQDLRHKQGKEVDAERHRLVIERDGLLGDQTQKRAEWQEEQLRWREDENRKHETTLASTRNDWAIEAHKRTYTSAELAAVANHTRDMAVKERDRLHDFALADHNAKKTGNKLVGVTKQFADAKANKFIDKDMTLEQFMEVQRTKVDRAGLTVNKDGSYIKMDKEGNPTYGVVPGSEAARAGRDETRRKAEVRYELGQDRDNIGRALDMLKEDPSLISGPVGSALAMMPGSKSATFRALLTSVKGQAAFKRLTQMRENSKTGGALGQVSNYEVKLLENAYAAISADMSAGELEKSLEQLQRRYDVIGGMGKEWENASDELMGAFKSNKNAVMPGGKSMRFQTFFYTQKFGYQPEQGDLEGRPAFIEPDLSLTGDDILEQWNRRTQRGN